MIGRLNIKCVVQIPAIAPVSWAIQYPTNSFVSSSLLAQNINETAGLRCAPEIGPKTDIKTYSPAPVAILLPSKATALLASAPGVKVIDERVGPDFPTPVRDAAGTDPVFVGRIRKDISTERGLNLWIVSDNVRKGAALNSIQIAEVLIKSLQ